MLKFGLLGAGVMGQAPAIATMNEACDVLDIAIAVQQSLVSSNIISL